MQRFILQQNQARFLQMLQTEPDDDRREVVRRLLIATQRDLAFLQSATLGVADSPLRPKAAFTPDPEVGRQFRIQFADSPNLCMAVDPGPGLHIIDVNDTFVRQSLASRDGLVGQPLFEMFPDNPEDPKADGVNNLYASLRMAYATGEPQIMPLQRYDVQAPDGRFVERYWRVVNRPMFDEAGRVLCLVQETERLEAGDAPTA